MAARRALRVLLLVNQFPPDVNTSGKLMRTLALELTRRGHQLYIVTTFPHYAQFRVEPRYRGRLYESAIEDGLHVKRVWCFTSGSKQKMWHRLLNYLTYNKLAFFAAQADGADYDVITNLHRHYCCVGSYGHVIAELRGAPKFLSTHCGTSD